MSSLLLGQEDIVARGEPQSISWASQGYVEIYEYFHIHFHSFTFAVVDEKDLECEIGCRIKHFHEVPGWRNWQTQRTQNPPGFGPWGFDSPSRHQVIQSSKSISFIKSWHLGAGSRAACRV